MRRFINRKTLSISAIIFFIISGLLLHFYAPQFITNVRQPLIQWWNPPPKIYDYQGTNFTTEKIEWSSKDQLKLHASLCKSIHKENDSSATNIIIFLHGIRSSGARFFSQSEKLAQKGWYTVCVDLRGHGQSEGSYCTFGAKEKYDIKGLVDILKTKYPNSHVGIWGQSLGGSVGVQTLSIDQRIEYGIIESTFANYSSITHDYSRLHLGFNISFLTSYLSNRAAALADFEPTEASTEMACKKVTQPILLTHGEADQHISVDYAYTNFKSLASENKKLHTIKEATHHNLWKVGGDAYYEFVCSFIEQQL